MMSSHVVMVPSPHSDGLLEVGECIGTLVGEEYQLGQGHRQEPLLLHPPELECQPVVCDIRGGCRRRT
jgi:hypothetical protein